jgi:hypothetical protein
MTEAKKIIEEISDLTRWDAHDKIILSAINVYVLVGSNHQIYDFADGSRIRYIADLNKYHIENQPNDIIF